MRAHHPAEAVVDCDRLVELAGLVEQVLPGGHDVRCLQAALDHDDVGFRRDSGLSSPGRRSVARRYSGDVRAMSIRVLLGTATVVDRRSVAFIAKIETVGRLSVERLIPDELDAGAAVGVLEVGIVVIDAAVNDADEDVASFEWHAGAISVAPGLGRAYLRDALIQSRMQALIRVQPAHTCGAGQVGYFREGQSSSDDFAPDVGYERAAELLDRS